MAKRKQIVTLENLIKYYGFFKGSSRFILRYTNRQKYYNRLVEDLELNFKEEMRTLEAKVSKLPINPIRDSSCSIWFFWYQGLDEAPRLIKENYRNLKRITENSTFEVVLLTKDNFGDYLRLPEYILEKVDDGKITFTHLSDIVRAGLLSKYGGIWIDSTCYVLENRFENIAKYAFYTQKYSPNMAHFFNNGRWSTFFMGSGIANPIETYLYEMFLNYFKKYDTVVDYFLQDTFIELGYENINIIKSLIDAVPYNNADILKVVNNFDSSQVPLEFSDDTWIVKLDRKKKAVSNLDTLGNKFYNHFIFKEGSNDTQENR